MMLSLMPISRQLQKKNGNSFSAHFVRIFSCWQNGTGNLHTLCRSLTNWFFSTLPLTPLQQLVRGFDLQSKTAVVSKFLQFASRQLN